MKLIQIGRIKESIGITNEIQAWAIEGNYYIFRKDELVNILSEDAENYHVKDKWGNNRILVKWLIEIVPSAFNPN